MRSSCGSGSQFEVGNGGSRLSYSQRQRLAIARGHHEEPRHPRVQRAHLGPRPGHRSARSGHGAGLGQGAHRRLGARAARTSRAPSIACSSWKRAGWSSRGPSPSSSVRGRRCRGCSPRMKRPPRSLCSAAPRGGASVPLRDGRRLRVTPRPPLASLPACSLPPEGGAVSTLRTAGRVLNMTAGWHGRPGQARIFLSPSRASPRANSAQRPFMRRRPKPIAHCSRAFMPAIRSSLPQANTGTVCRRTGCPARPTNRSSSPDPSAARRPTSSPGPDTTRSASSIRTIW